MWSAKVTTVGNSLGIVLPREVIARLRVAKGDALFLLESPMGIELTPFDPRFAEQLQSAEHIARHERDVIWQLAMSEKRPPAAASAARVKPSADTPDERTPPKSEVPDHG